jgi:hypothetical protein
MRPSEQMFVKAGSSRPEPQSAPRYVGWFLLPILNLLDDHLVQPPHTFNFFCYVHMFITFFYVGSFEKPLLDGTATSIILCFIIYSARASEQEIPASAILSHILPTNSSKMHLNVVYTRLLESFSPTLFSDHSSVSVHSGVANILWVKATRRILQFRTDTACFKIWKKKKKSALMIKGWLRYYVSIFPHFKPYPRHEKP